MAKLSYDVVSEYLMGVFSGWFVEHQDPPARPEDMASVIRQFRRKAEKFGDLPYLRIAVEHILSNPALDPKILADFSFNDDYAFEPDEVRRILEYLYRKTWPDAPALGGSDVYPAVEWLRDMDWHRWQKQKAELNSEAR